MFDNNRNTNSNNCNHFVLTRREEATSGSPFSECLPEPLNAKDYAELCRTAHKLITFPVRATTSGTFMRKAPYKTWKGATAPALDWKGEHPRAYAIRCGMMPGYEAAESYLLVEDSDCKGGKQGLALHNEIYALLNIRQEDNPWTIRTISGGLHNYHRCTLLQEVTIHAHYGFWKSLDIDLQGEGHYVVAPYSWLAFDDEQATPIGCYAPDNESYAHEPEYELLKTTIPVMPASLVQFYNDLPACIEDHKARFEAGKAKGEFTLIQKALDAWHAKHTKPLSLPVNPLCSVTTPATNATNAKAQSGLDWSNTVAVKNFEDALQSAINQEAEAKGKDSFKDDYAWKRFGACFRTVFEDHPNPDEWLKWFDRLSATLPNYRAGQDYEQLIRDNIGGSIGEFVKQWNLLFTGEYVGKCSQAAQIASAITILEKSSTTEHRSLFPSTPASASTPAAASVSRESSVSLVNKKAGRPKKEKEKGESFFDAELLAELRESYRECEAWLTEKGDGVDFAYPVYNESLQWIHVNDGEPSCTAENIAVLMNCYGLRVRWDDMQHQPCYSGFGVHEGEHQTAMGIVEQLVKVNGLPMWFSADVRKGFEAWAKQNRFHRAKEWIESKPWDGDSRIETLARTITVAPEHVGSFDVCFRTWAMGAINALYSVKGGSSKHCLVFQGKQSIGKTSWFRTLAGNQPICKDGVILNPKDKDSVSQTISCWLVELGELDATFKASDIADLKAFLTKTEDEWRAPYDSKANKYPRRTAFFASVNESEFLADRTGNSRFAAFAVEQIDYQHKVDVQQFWAECLHIWKNGTPDQKRHYLTKEEEAQLNESNEELTAKGVIYDSLESMFDWSDASMKHLKAGVEGKLTASEMPKFNKEHFHTNAQLNFLLEVKNQSGQKELRAALEKLGAVNPKKAVKVNGVVAKGWYLPKRVSTLY